MKKLMLLLFITSVLTTPVLANEDLIQFNKNAKKIAERLSGDIAEYRLAGNAAPANIDEMYELPYIKKIMKVDGVQNYLIMYQLPKKDFIWSDEKEKIVYTEVDQLLIICAKSGSACYSATSDSSTTRIAINIIQKNIDSNEIKIIEKYQNIWIIETPWWH